MKGSVWYVNALEFGIIITLEENKVIPWGPVYWFICRVAEIFRVSFTRVQTLCQTDFLKARSPQSFQGLILKQRIKCLEQWFILAAL